MTHKKEEDVGGREYRGVRGSFNLFWKQNTVKLFGMLGWWSLQWAKPVALTNYLEFFGTRELSFPHFHYIQSCIYSSISTWIFLLHSELYLRLLDLTLLLKWFQLWPLGALPFGSYAFLTYSHLCTVYSFASFLFAPSPRISHFLKDPFTKECYLKPTSRPWMLFLW